VAAEQGAGLLVIAKRGQLVTGPCGRSGRFVGTSVEGDWIAFDGDNFMAMCRRFDSVPSRVRAEQAQASQPVALAPVASATFRSKDLSDFAILSAVLARADLPTVERRAFRGMMDGLQRWSALTLRQRQWVEQVAARLGLIEGGGDRTLPPKPRGTSAWDPGSAKTFGRGSSAR
jgi:hypothetical protein